MVFAAMEALDLHRRLVDLGAVSGFRYLLELVIEYFSLGECARAMEVVSRYSEEVGLEIVRRMDMSAGWWERLVSWQLLVQKCLGADAERVNRWCELTRRSIRRWQEVDRWVLETVGEFCRSDVASHCEDILRHGGGGWFSD